MPTPQRYRVTASCLNVRQGPSVTATVLGWLRRDEVAEWISTSGDGYWLKVRRGDLEGWCAHKYLAAVVAEPEPAEEFPWLPIALAEVGVKEFPGDGDNPRIVEYLQSTSLEAPSATQDETPWCSAFANWCVERSGYEGTDSAWARSWLTWGRAARRPRRGCIVVLSRDRGGHVGFWVGETGTQVRLLGGNQGDEVRVSGYPKKRVLGYRVPGA